MKRMSALFLASSLILVALPCARAGDEAPDDLAAFEQEHAARATEAREFDFGFAVDDPEVGLQEVFRKSFQPPLGVGYGFKALPGTPYVMAYSWAGDLFTVNPSEGTVLEWITYGPYGFGDAVGGDSHRRRMIIPTSSSAWDSWPTRILDITDPRRVREIPTEGRCGREAAILPGAAIGVTFGDYRKTCILDLDSGEIRHTFSWTTSEAHGVLSNGSPGLILKSQYYARDADYYAMFDLGDPDNPAFLYSIETPKESRLVVDRYFRFMVVASDAETQVRDLPTGAVLSVLEWPNEYAKPVLVHDEVGSTLALVGRETVDLFDLSNPAEPRYTLSFDIEPIRSGYRPPARAHSGEPWIAVSTVNPGGVVVIDVRDGSEVLRHQVEGTSAMGLEWTETESGEPAIVYFGYFSTDRQYDIRPQGGKTVMDTLLLESTGEDPRIARISQVTPNVIQAAFPLGGRWVGVVDMANNAILLVDTADGTVLDTIGYDQHPPISDNHLRAASGGSTFVVGDSYGFNIFDVVDEHLVRRISRPVEADTTGNLRDVAVRQDGTVVVLTAYALLTFGPERQPGHLELDGGYSGIDLSETGGRAVLSANSIWGGENHKAHMVDLSDSSNPRSLWVAGAGVKFVDFVRGDAAVAVTLKNGEYWGFSPLLLDADTGEVLGEPGRPTAVFYYYAPSCAFGHDGDSSLLYWRWTWIGWKSVLYNVSTDTPQLFPESEEYYDSPWCVPRPDGKSAYEFREWSGKLESDVMVVLPDGIFRGYGTTTVNSPKPLRHGFLTGHATIPVRHREELVVVRDPEMNRPPVASATDQVVECNDASGTPVLLDGSGSSDPDSTPGTDDDIASYAWAVDGDAAGDGETVESSLDLGSHAVELTVTDVLGLTGSDSAVIEVADTLSPDLSLDLTPMLQGGNVWAHEWQVKVAATDLCDGVVDPSVWVATALDGETSYVPADSNRIELRTGRKGSEVMLYGPDRTLLEVVWAQARMDGGLELDTARAVDLITLPAPPRGIHRDTAAIYRLDEAGILTGATAFGGSADIRFISRVEDRSGQEAAKSLSLREVREEHCAAFPGNLDCFSGGI
ncbi:MAG: hypothetical protein IFK94_13005 [Acidobacteria bacterium]|uniref:PKD/Chitinase domain-containing protein n=1 Tax=Candidatus Polarisedimenticola svalbardensis TaxID=2886004 RepID=A0A8J6Y832_9BACT|nr:hypothetical protein [Candidatus Polarisedimenticola svalbardensis]